MQAISKAGLVTRTGVKRATSYFDVLRDEQRAESPLLGLIVVPLALMASGLTGLWVVWPLLVSVSWVATPSWRWSWALALELGIIGTVWGFIGATFFAQEQGAPLLVGVAWAGMAGVLAVLGSVNRRLH